MPAQTESIQYPYTVSYRDVKHPRLEFRTGELLLVLPHGHDECRMIEKHRNWIEQKYRYIDEAISTSVTMTLATRSKDEFRKKIRELAQVYAQELGCAPNRIFVKRMCSKWASCSKRGNLTINSLAKYLPDNLVEYIIFHEMVHLINPKHDSQFWKYLNKKFERTGEIEKNLCSYWFQIQKKPKSDMI